MTKQNQNICCVCGKIATNYHRIIGQLIFDVCEKHYLTLIPAMGYCDKMQSPRIGLIDKNKKFVDLKYWGKESE